MIRFILIILALSVFNIGFGQNLFSKKLDNCSSERFCLDCGDIKANVDTLKLQSLISTVTASSKLNGIKGKVVFQIILDSTGKGCVLSHTDAADNVISRNITAALNNFDGFLVAETNNVKEAKTSFNMLFEIANETITAKVARVDMNAFKKSFDKPNSPEIYSKHYVYENKHLNNYAITVWDSKNSNLPNNMNDHIAIDKKGTIWLTADDMMVKFDGSTFRNIQPQDTSVKKRFEVYTIASDENNLKWVYGHKNILSFNDRKWTSYEQTTTGISDVRKIINNEKSNELFFCSSKGLTIFKGGVWTYFNSDKKYPFDDIYFAKRDSKNQIWIGTFGGSFLIDALGKCTTFNETSTVLKGQCITAMDEDENGNLYFSLYEYGSKTKGAINRNEGIAIRSVNGDWQQLTTSNSGMPFNNTTGLLYDKREKILWISTDRAGLVRYNLKNEWENYHPDNSKIPTSYISDMAFDTEGTLYLATRQGLVKIARK